MRLKLFLLVALLALVTSPVIQTPAAVAQETPPTPQNSVPGAQPAGSAPAAPATAQTPAHFDGNSWWNHVKVLADDKMEGRHTGSRGERKAQAYVVKTFSDAGLEPAGTNGFYQPVKFTSRQLVIAKSSLALVHEGKTTALNVPQDAILGTNIDISREPVEAPLVFVGYGLRIPEQNYDDFAGLDLKGKIVVYFSGSPAEVPSALSAHYQSTLERWKAIRDTGAIGMVRLLNPASMDLPWERITGNVGRPHLTLADPEFDETAGAKLSLLMNPAKAAQLFAGSGHSYDDIVAAGKKREALPKFPLNVSLKAHVVVKEKTVESNNIVAKLPGTDPALRNEYVVFSAHLDHLGVGAPINGDKVYNGAMDNGSGVALLMDVANSLKKTQEKLKRTVLFLAVTGEEEGLLGSKYFAAHPTVDRKSIIADINADMFLPIVPLKIVEAQGLDESDLGDDVREVAAREGVKVEPDPEPLRNAFIRSDQYSFIRQGVPSILLDVGYEKGSPEQQTFKQWRMQRYHAPSDDSKQPVDLKTAAQVEEIYRELLIKVADSDAQPHWKATSFFRRFAAP